MNESFTIQPEFLYYQKGIRNKFDLLGEDYVIKQRLNYFEIPILAKFMFFAQEAGQVYGAFGPSFGLGLNGKFKSDDFDEDISFEDDNLAKLDISLTIGGGIQVPVGPGKVFLDARYLLGLNSIDNSAVNSDIKNRGIAIGLGVLLPIGG